ncbi:MAG TPA: tetratricopeptide repeat protein [Longimicrobiaceae bacterium]|nr:tetratricopeptide repeat protein [Longimicrobiaceae bacterium]
MQSYVPVEHAVSLIPHTTEFLPLINAVIGASGPDRRHTWDRSGKYATVCKRVVDPAGVRERIPALAAQVRERLQELFSLVMEAIRAYQAGELEVSAATFVRAGELEEGEGRLAEAERLYLLALEVAEAADDRRPEILALRRLGRAAHAAGRLAESRDRYERSYFLSVRTRDLPGQAAACRSLGAIWAEQGRWADARAWYTRGMQLAGRLDPELRYPFLCRLAALALQVGDLDEAEAQLEQARQAIEATGVEQDTAPWHHTRGLLLDARGDLPGAERAYREGLDRVRQPACEIRMRVDLGHNLVRQGRLFEAREEARRAEEMAIRRRLVPALVGVYGLLGAVAREQCDEDGFVFFEQALELCREQELPKVHEAAVYHEYGLFLQSCGHASEAPAYLELARELYREMGLAREVERVSADLRGVEG